MPASLVPRYHISFFSIPKAASTSIKLSLYKLQEGVDWQGDPDTIHRYFVTHPVKSVDFLLSNEFYKFTVIRDPIKRLISSYDNRVNHHKDIAKDVRKKFGSEAAFKKKHPDLSIFPDIDDYFVNLRKYQKLSYRIWYHTVSAVKFTGNDLSYFDDVYAVSNLDQLESHLSALTGQTVKFQKVQEAGRRFTFNSLSKQAKRTIRKQTKSDYEFFSSFL